MNFGEHGESIHKRLGQVERVLNEANIRRFADTFLQDDFHDVEPKPDARMAEQPEIIKRGAAHVVLFFFRDGFARCAVVVALASFDFDEDQPFAVPANDVNLTGARLEPADKNPVAVPPEIPGGEFLAAFAERHFRSGIDSEFAQPVPSHTGILTGSLPFNKLRRDRWKTALAKIFDFRKLIVTIRRLSMQRIQEWFIRSAIAVMLFATQGCALLLVSAGAGAAVGVVSYTGNELRVTQDATLNHAWDAANAAMRDLEFTVIPAETHKDGLGGILQGKNAKQQRVQIQLLRQTEQTTEIRIRVGEFDTAANKAAALLFYDKLKMHL